MIPKIVHFTVPRDPSPQQEACIDRARELLAGWEIRVWRDPVAPDGMRLSEYWANARSGAQLADLIRLGVLERFGGVYLDSDLELLRSLDPLAEAYDFFIASEDGERATNAVIGAVAGHPAIRAIIDELEKQEPDWSLSAATTTGPVLFGKVLKWRRDVTVLPREAFYAYNFDQRPADAPPTAFGIHRWAGSWVSSPRWLQTAARLAEPRVVAAGVARRARSWQRGNEFAIRAFAPRGGAFALADEILINTVHGHKLIADGHDLSVTPELADRGFYELPEELFFKRVLAGGDLVVDVGANIGVFTILAARCVGTYGRVVAFEPNPGVARLLRRSAKMNWMHERIDVRQEAVGAVRGNAALRFTPDALGGASVVDGHASTSEPTIADSAEQVAIDVSVATLDGEFPVDLPIKLLKIDAEGFEVEVLKGAARLIAAGAVEHIMLEAVREVAGASWHQLLTALADLREHGFAPYRIAWNGHLRRIEWADLREGNLGNSRNVVLRRDSWPGPTRLRCGRS